MAERRRQRTERIQVTVLAKDYPTKKRCSSSCAGVRDAYRGRRERRERRCHPSCRRGPGHRRPEAVIYSQTRDFIVTWRTPL
jgi:hypothetical protein